MKKVAIVYGQSIWDIAIQEYGSVESVFDFIADNGFVTGLDTILIPGQIVKIISAPSDRATLTYIQTNNIRVVGGTVPTGLTFTIGRGHIDFNNTGTNAWQVRFNYAPDSVYSSSGAELIGVQHVVIFWSAGTPVMVDENMSVSDVLVDVAGYGAGVIDCQCLYAFADGTAFFIQSLYLVDNDASVIASVETKGVDFDGMSGNELYETAIVDFHACSYLGIWHTPTDGDNIVGMTPDVTVTITPAIQVLAYSLIIDSLFQTDYAGPFPYFAHFITIS